MRAPGVSVTRYRPRISDSATFTALRPKRYPGQLRGPALKAEYSNADGLIVAQRSGRKQSGSEYKSGLRFVRNELSTTRAPFGTRRPAKLASCRARHLDRASS